MDHPAYRVWSLLYFSSRIFHRRLSESFLRAVLRRSPYRIFPPLCSSWVYSRSESPLCARLNATLSWQPLLRFYYISPWDSPVFDDGILFLSGDGIRRNTSAKISQCHKALWKMDTILLISHCKRMVICHYCSYRFDLLYCWHTSDEFLEIYPRRSSMRISCMWFSDIWRRITPSLVIKLSKLLWENRYVSILTYFLLWKGSIIVWKIVWSLFLWYA